MSKISEQTSPMQTVIVSGASSGIGFVTAKLFLEHGWCVYDLSRRGSNLPGIRHIYCDLSDDQSCASAIAQVLQEAEHIDVCICNAGIGISGAVEFTDMADAKHLMDVNFFGTLRLVQAVLPNMRARRSGKIIFTSSIAAILPVPYQALYSASKAAVNALALSLQNEVRTYGIRIACLLPGDVHTGFTEARKKSIRGEDIYQTMNKAVAKMEYDELHGIEAAKMAHYLWEITQQKRPWIFNIHGCQYRFFCFLHRTLPTSLVNWIEGKVYS